jgi:hypothetical protein
MDRCQIQKGIHQDVEDWLVQIVLLVDFQSERLQHLACASCHLSIFDIAYQPHHCRTDSHFSRSSLQPESTHPNHCYVSEHCVDHFRFVHWESVQKQ